MQEYKREKKKAKEALKGLMTGYENYSRNSCKRPAPVTDTFFASALPEGVRSRKLPLYRRKWIR